MNKNVILGLLAILIGYTFIYHFSQKNKSFVTYGFLAILVGYSAIYLPKIIAAKIY